MILSPEKQIDKIKYSLAKSFDCIRNYAFVWLGIWILEIILNEANQNIISRAQNTGFNGVFFIAILVLLSLASGFAISSFELLICANEIKNLKLNFQKDLPRTLQNLNQMLIEEVRSLSKIIWGFVFFIFPGFNSIINYMWSPFVVLFEEKYQKGELDALAFSKKLSYKHFWFLSLALTITSLIDLVSGLLIESGDSHLSSNPVGVCLSAGVSLFLNIIFKFYYIYVYEELAQKERGQ